MPTMVTAQDLATHLDTTVKTAQAEQVLDLVEADVLTEYGSDTAPAPGRALQLLRHAVLSAAARVLSNPAGLLSETLGEYTYRRGQTGMALTDTERDLIAAARRPVGPASAMTSVGVDVDGWRWIGP